MPGERHLHLRREDLDLPAPGIVDEHRLRETKVARNVLAPFTGDLSAAEEHAERVAKRAVGSGEDA
jgi:hypothetical protein